MKITVFFIIGILFSSSVLVTGLSNEKHTQTSTLSLSFHEPSLIANESSFTVLMDGAPACMYQPGKPVLPMYTTTLQLPFGSVIEDVSIHFEDVHTLLLDEKITLAPHPFIQGTFRKPSVQTMTEEYGTTDLYPFEWTAYFTGGGLNQRQ